MVLENFTTYNEVDGDGDFTITSSKIDVVTMDRGAVSYVSKDFGASHFGDFEHLFEFFANSSSGDNCHCWVGVQDTVGTVEDWVNGLSFLYTQSTGGFADFFAYRTVSGTDTAGTSVRLSRDTLYYGKSVRSSGTITHSFYTDSDRTSLAGSCSQTGGPTGGLRYYEPIVSREVNGGSLLFTGFIQNVDLQDVAAIIFNQEINETLTISELFGTIPTSLFNETTTLSETLKIIATTLLDESTTLSEELITKMTTLFAETLSLSELLDTIIPGEVQVTLSQEINEAIALTESLITSIISVFSETLALSEVLESVITSTQALFFKNVRLNSHIAKEITLNSHLVGH